MSCSTNQKRSMISRLDPQGFWSIFNRKTGLFIRGELPDGSDPIYSSFPELVDCKITNQCYGGCSYCYMNSTPDGKHCSLDDYKRILKELAEGGTNQIALGGGEPTLHPQFAEILKLTREAGIVPTYSTGAIYINPDILRATKDYAGAAAVSWHTKHAYRSIKLLCDRRIKTNVHIILNPHHFDYIEKLINFFDNSADPIPNAIVFLRYKPIGRAKDLPTHQIHDKDWEHFFEIIEEEHPYKIGFDACLMPLVNKYLTVPEEYFELCDAGRFSCYIDAVELKMAPCSFAPRKFQLYDGVNISRRWRWMVLHAREEPCRIGLFETTT